MNKVKAIFLLVVGIFLFGCGSSSSSVQTLDDIPESFIDGTEDLGEYRMNSSRVIYNEDATAIDESATKALEHIKYDLPTLSVINTEAEFQNIKYFLLPDEISRLGKIDLSSKTLLFVSWLYSSPKRKVATIKEIKYGKESQIHCVVYMYNNQSGSLSMADINADFHAFTIPKAVDISYEVVSLR